jgi:hypothetical protein
MYTSSRLKLRTFLSSPGDVPVQRDRVATRLQKDFVAV